ncbi:MAG: ABC transporter permease [Myxococcales bacterium]|nr:ABC transporter permease [Myxococcales bacterium]
MTVRVFLENLLAAGVLRGVPLLFAALGELWAERSGVLCLSIEGTLLLGALAGYAATLATASPFMGLLCALAVGLICGLLHAALVVGLRVDQVIAGLGLSFVASGLASMLGTPLVEARKVAAQLPVIALPSLSAVPLLGPLLSQHSIVLELALSVWLITALVFSRTRLGLDLTAVGENPSAADAMGLSVLRLRVLAVVIGSGLFGIAGASLSLAVSPGWVEGLSAGQGFIALVLVIFGRFRPSRVALGAFLFGVIRRLPLDLQGVTLPDFIERSFLRGPGSTYVLDMLPYVMTMAVLALQTVRVRRAQSETTLRLDDAPWALGRPYHRAARHER